jgi:subtilisin family serine protease
MVSQRNSRSFISAVKVLLCSALLLAINGKISAGFQVEGLNSDLESIKSKANSIEAFAQRCLEMECPQLDCEIAVEIQGDLDKLRLFLDLMSRWLKVANDDAKAHFSSLVDQGTMTGEQLAKVQEILAWQSFTMGIANGLLDIADIVDFSKGILQDPSKLNPQTLEEMVNHVWKLDKLIKNTESLATNVASGVSGGGEVPKAYAELTPDAFGLQGSDWNKVKGYSGELMGAITAMKENMALLKGAEGLSQREKLWKAFNGFTSKEGKGINLLKDQEGPRANFLSALGSLASAWGESDLKERAQRAQDLRRDQIASDIAQSKSFNELKKYQNQRFLAEDTLQAVKDAYQALTACMKKADCSMTRSLVALGNILPAWIRNMDTSAVGYEGTTAKPKMYGEALPAIRKTMSDLKNSFLGSPLPGLLDDCGKKPESALTSVGLSDLGLVRIGSQSPVWCKTTDGNPTIVPFDGPGDIPVPGRGTSGGAEPGDVKPSGGRTPAGARPDLYEDLSNLRTHATHLWREIQDPNTTVQRRDEAQKQLDQVTAMIHDLEKKQPEEGKEEPGKVEEPEKKEPPEVSVPTVTIYVKAKTSVLVGAQDAAQAVTGQQVKLFGASVANPALPGDGVEKPQTDHALGPIQGTTDDKGNLALTVPVTALGVVPPEDSPLNGIGGPAFQVTVDATPQNSVNVKVGGGDFAAAIGSIPGSARRFLVDVNKINGSVFMTFTYPAAMADSMNKVLVSIPGVVNIEINFCRTKQVTLDDPYFTGKGAWGQSYDDQWAIKRVGLTGDEESAWNKLGANPQPIIVAVIDSGLDWNHLDFDWKNLWQNPNEIPNNGKDDDGNGYVDDMIGWDFFANSNKPWDHDGHGTIVSGIIAAAQNNGIGMAGINPHARIMVCKALNNFGNTRASYLAKAIVYAVDNGARVINMSVGGKNLSQIEQEAVAYAVSKGVLIVVASGNEGVNVEGYGLAGIEGVLTVAATGMDNKRQVFSNWGSHVGIAAPGIDVLGLRARLTDTMRDIPGVEYVNGANFVGDDNRYYRGSGTSFAAPIVTGVASLVMSKHPEFTGRQVAQVLKQSATDIDVAGVDQYSGYGLVNAAAAMDTSPEFFIESLIERVEVAQGDSGPEVQVFGTSDADQFQKATIAIGAGDDPSSWKDVLEVTQIVKGGLLGSIPAKNFVGAKVWMIRLTTEHRSGMKREFRFRLSVG